MAKKDDSKKAKDNKKTTSKKEEKKVENKKPEKKEKTSEKKKAPTPKSSKKESAKKSEKGYSSDDLAKLAEEMNEIMGLDPAIDIELEEEALLGRITEESVEIRPDDDFSKESVDLLIKLGLMDDGSEKEGTEEEDENSNFVDEENEPEQVAEEEVDETETVKEDKKDKKSGKGKNKPEPKKSKAEPKKSKEKAKETEEKKKSDKNSPKKPTEKKVGVIVSIVEFIEASGEKGITKKQIVEKIKKRFPERKEKSIQSTVNVQVPGRIRKDRGLNLVKDDEGRWSIKSKSKSKK